MSSDTVHVLLRRSRASSIGSWRLAVVVAACLAPFTACRRAAEKAEPAGPAAGQAARPAASPVPATAAPPAPATAAPPAAAAPTVASWDGFMPDAGPVLVGRPTRASDLTPTEQQYGMAPQRGLGVVFQDQVVLVEHGDKAVRAWNTNGLEWTLDGTDPRIAGLQEGQILFATSRCVGRVLKLTRSGDEVTVILGPVQLTDVIKQGNLSYDQPLDLNTLTAVQMPNAPGAFGSPIAAQMKKASSGGAGADDAVQRDIQYYVVSPNGRWRPMPTIGRPAVALRARANEATFPRIVRTAWSPQLPDVFFNDVLTASPCWLNCGGLGLKMTATQGGVTVNINAIFHLSSPKLTFNAGISNGSISGWVNLSGAGGFEMSVEGISDQGFSANINQTGEIPVDLMLPLPIGGAPLEAHFHQNVSLASGFSAKTSVLRAKATFDVTGNLQLKYAKGSFTVPPLETKSTNSLSRDVNGISMGIDSMVFGVNQQLLVGVGVAGFATGPYVGLTSTITALKQATEAATTTLMNGPVADCRQGTFLMLINGGIGYTIPKVVATVVNFFLGIVHAKPIEPSGSIIKLLDPVKLIDTRSQMPSGCAGK